ncbi:MAG: DUF3078 domain-containing protein [Balneolaceae bacterium]|nr:DUF3078 domain-containing protein [Balneolaceae bacterium]MCH8550075.1 DUF3078 domain-containing protein [Balneolaceae bacterium]
MKKLLLTFALLFTASLTVQAQDAISIPDTLSGWNYSWDVDFNGSQAAYSNWSQGGVNNIAATGNSSFTGMYREGRFSYGARLSTRFGQTRIQDEGVRKTDDRLSLRNRFLYDLGEEDGDFKIFGNINFRTQFAEGFDYGAGPDDTNLLISDFLAPAYINQNAGLAYIPTENFSFEAGLGLQQTIVRNDDLAPLYGLNEGDNFRNEAGLTFAAGYNFRLATNIRVNSTVETFTNLQKAIRSTDVQFSNQFIGRINNYMNVSLRLDFVYDDDFSKELQVAQVLSLGVSFSVI